MGLNFCNILLRHNKSVVTSRSECDITAKLGNHIFAAPVCAANMKSILNYDICKIFDKRNWFYIYHRLCGVDDVLNFVKYSNEDNFNVISISVGVKQEDLLLLKQIKSNSYRIDYITIDVALSFNDNIIPIVEYIKNNFPNTYLIVGNGCTVEWIRFLEALGVDCAKVNIGVSTSCRTRQSTGFGSTSVSSLLECADNSKIDIISDGGLTVVDGEVWIGDIAKAIVLGADFVMSGRVFAGCIDCPASLNGYFGNASEMAKGHKKHIEGAQVKVASNGKTIEEMMDLIEDSLKSSISYSGGKTLNDLKNVKWSIVN
jgi:GMP reductase